VRAARRLRRALLVLAVTIATGCPFRGAREEAAVPTSPGRPAELLADKETALAAVVRVREVETRWVILPDGDHVSLLVLQCEPEEALLGGESWPPGTVQAVAQLDYSDLISEPIAPPALEGRRYVLWASPPSADSEIPALTPWVAHAQGLLLIRGSGDERFVYWGKETYALAAVEDALRRGDRAPLDEIVDPGRRLRVASLRLGRDTVGDPDAFVRGLMANVLDPDGQARNARPPGSATPHALWYRSISLLRDLGRDERYRARVLAALEPVARMEPQPRRLAAALALVDLGSDAGRDALIRGFEVDSGPVSSDSSDGVTFPGHYPHDESSVTACAHALARLGDRRGLGHAKPAVRLAAAEALAARPDTHLRRTVEEIARRHDAKVRKLKSAGGLTRPRRAGDHTNRYPAEWVQANALLGRMGDDRALRRLVEAQVLDAGTYPHDEVPLVPAGRTVTWSSRPSLLAAIATTDASRGEVLHRVEGLYAADRRWEEPAFRTLRAALGDPSVENAAAARERRPDEQEIAGLLASEDANERAQGLAAAGYHRISAFYARIEDTALHGSGIERQAALYALGFYQRDIPDDVLRRLMATGGAEFRLTALELATRKNPERFAGEAMDVVRFSLAERAEGIRAYVPRLLSRFSRDGLAPPLVDALRDPDAEVRKVVAEGLGMGGDPAAVTHLEPLTRDRDSGVRAAAHAAIELLGPTDAPSVQPR